MKIRHKIVELQNIMQLQFNVQNFKENEGFILEGHNVLCWHCIIHTEKEYTTKKKNKKLLL